MMPRADRAQVVGLHEEKLRKLHGRPNPVPLGLAFRSATDGRGFQLCGCCVRSFL